LPLSNDSLTLGSRPNILTLILTLRTVVRIG
jgi:hypothetical protein